MSASFRLGRLDHVHITVPDRAEAAAWYSEHLGFEPVEDLRFWAEGVDGGPLQMSADGGSTTIALFPSRGTEPDARHQAAAAFSVEGAAFVEFARSLPGVIPSLDGDPLTVDDLVDFDLCFAFDFSDPWGNHYELNCFDHALVRAELVEPLGLTPQRKWPEDMYDRWRKSHQS